MTRYLTAEKMEKDDFGRFFTKLPGEVVYDAKTVHGGGQWATMTEESYKRHGAGVLGLGSGQKYVRNEQGELHKVAG